MACYIAFLVVLVSKRGDANWDRLVYLFSGFEAIVFAAAGMVFGTSVQRSQLNAARQEAAVAKEDAARNAQDAQHLNALSAIIEAKAAGQAPSGYPASSEFPAPSGYPAAYGAQPPAGTFGGRPSTDPKSLDHISPDPQGPDPQGPDHNGRDLKDPRPNADLAELARIVQAIRSTRG